MRFKGHLAGTASGKTVYRRVAAGTELRMG